MSLNQDDVTQILKFMDDSSFSELRLEIGDVKIHVNKRAGSIPIEKGEFASLDSDGLSTTRGTALKAMAGNPVSSPSKSIEAPLESKPIMGEEIFEEGLVPIRSPMLGTFYRAPKPEEPPFVEVGAEVSEEMTVCIIEVMKLFSAISAGLNGRITKICAEDGQLVEYDQVLFLVDPATD
jgi:acetyl-CoA carboxylase biotin carboxyl carrier protein